MLEEKRSQINEVVDQTKFDPTAQYICNMVDSVMRYPNFYILSQLGSAVKKIYA